MNLFRRLQLKIQREAHILASRGQTVSLEDALRQTHSLAVPAGRTISTGSRLHNSYLAQALAHEELGTWALDFQAVDFLEREIRSCRPKAILEFGTGISTICFARFMSETADAPQPCVFSIEQNIWQVEKSREQLIALGLDPYVRILHAPLKAQMIEGLETECYDLPEDRLQEFLAGARPDFIIVDGPCGNGTVRFGTLPLIQNHAAPGAKFYLDDAFRPEELDVAMRWSTLPTLSLSGLRKIGKGILTGQFVARAVSETSR